MNTFTTVGYNVLAQSCVHPDRYPLSRPEALDAALLCLQEVEPAIHDDLRARLDATRPEPSDHLPLRVDFA